MRAATLAILTLAACATPAPPPAPTPPTPTPPAPTSTPPTPAAALQDVAGESTDTAVSVPADAPEEGVPFENDWIYRRYGTFERSGGGTGTLAGRRYDVVEVELPSGERHKVYFDITENWARWTPPPPK